MNNSTSSNSQKMLVGELEGLLALVALHDRKAFSRLYVLVSPRLFGVLLRMVPTRDIAEEILQDCFISIWQRSATYMSSKSQPMTWMTSIVRNRALDYLRSQKNSDIAVDDADEMVLSIADDSPGALAVLLSVAEAKLLRNCLKLLDAHQQESIAAAFYRGLSHDQVASELGIALGTVKSWIRRGLERLRQCMDGNTG